VAPSEELLKTCLYTKRVGRANSFLKTPLLALSFTFEVKEVQRSALVGCSNHWRRALSSSFVIGRIALGSFVGCAQPVQGGAK
jgi:hypothetical protein